MHCHRILAAACVLLLSLSVTTLHAGESEEELIRYMVCTLHAQYPQANLQDVYKTCYQDFFGAEHAAPDSARALQYLHRELMEMALDSLRMPTVEPCGYHHRYERVSLALVADGTLSEQQLLSSFLHAASDTQSPPGDWVVTWSLIEQTALLEVPEWNDPALRAQLQAAAAAHQPVHHSDAFRCTYHPHYRIVPSPHL